MHTKTLLAASLSTMLHLATADFQVFVGGDNEWAGLGAAPGGNIAVTYPNAYFFAHAPDCNGDLGGQLMGKDDVSHGRSGYVCKGCDAEKSGKDQVPTSFEIHDPDASIFAGGGDDVHFTLYRDESNGGYNMVDAKTEASIGICTIPEERNDWTCAHGVFGIDSAWHFFDCKTDITLHHEN